MKPSPPTAATIKPVGSKGDRRAIYLLFTANAVSLVGNQLTHIAIPWFVLETTGSAVQTGHETVE